MIARASVLVPGPGYFVFNRLDALNQCSSVALFGFSEQTRYMSIDATEETNPPPLLDIRESVRHDI